MNSLTAPYLHPWWFSNEESIIGDKVFNTHPSKIPLSSSSSLTTTKETTKTSENIANLIVKDYLN